MLVITHVRTQAGADAIRAMVPEYFSWIRARYPDDAANIDACIKARDIDVGLMAVLASAAAAGCKD